MDVSGLKEQQVARSAYSRYVAPSSQYKLLIILYSRIGGNGELEVTTLQQATVVRMGGKEALLRGPGLPAPQDPSQQVGIAICIS